MMVTPRWEALPTTAPDQFPSSISIANLTVSQASGFAILISMSTTVSYCALESNEACILVACLLLLFGLISSV